MKKNKKHINKFLDGSRNKPTNTNPIHSKETQNTKNNFLFARLKAFLVDMFLINMPILYITTYVILQGKNDFLNNQLAITLCTSIYCFILFCFFVLKGQTPGFRYAEIMLCSNIPTNNPKEQNQDNEVLPKAWQVVVFLVVWLIELSFFLWILSFFQKERKTLHELASKTKIIYKHNPIKA